MASGTIQAIFNAIYPVGSIYMSVNNASPATLFGGTWTQIKDTFLLAAGSSYSAGSTGGEATHTLTVDEMPAHGHSLSFASYGSLYGDFLGGGASSKRTAYPSTATSVGDALRADNTGGGKAHNNMPPYLAVYVWKRTA